MPENADPVFSAELIQFARETKREIQVLEIGDLPPGQLNTESPPMQDEITVTLTLEELMAIPGDGICRIIDKAKPSAEFLRAALDYETRPLYGKGRWIIMNHLRNLLTSR